jgi:alpha-N-arabinofuranosidase
VVATADHVGARLGSRKKLKLSFDEWNVWYQSRFVGQHNLDWTLAPELIEDDFTAADAVVVGSLLITLLQHADRVGVACQAQLVNVIAPIRTEAGGAAWRQSIFHPFALTARLARGSVLRLEPRSPRVDTAAYGDVAALDATATHDEATGETVLLAVNRDSAAPLRVEADLRPLVDRFGQLELVEHHVLAVDDRYATNSADSPDRVRPRTGTGADLRDSTLCVELPPASWSALRLQPLTRETR